MAGAPPGSAPPSQTGPLTVYVEDPALRAAVAKAIELWNQAAGRQLFKLTNTTSAAVVVKHQDWPGYAKSGRSDTGTRGAEGGRGNGDPRLITWIDPSMKLGTSYAVNIIAHELGHNLGLNHPAEQGGAGLLNAQGIMGQALGSPTPGEVQQALYQQGDTNQPYTPNPQDVRNVEAGVGPWGISEYGMPNEPQSLPGSRPPNWHDVETGFNQDLALNGGEGGPDLVPYLHTAAMLVARGNEYRGTDPAGPGSASRFGIQTYRLAEQMQASGKKSKPPVHKSTNQASSAQQVTIK